MRCIAAALFAALLVAGGQEAEARPRYRLDVEVDPVARLARGRVAIEADNPTQAPLTALELWLYPERLKRFSRALDEHNFYWAYPRSFNSGGIALAGLTVDGKPVRGEVRDEEPAGPGTLLIVPLGEPLQPGGRARVEVAFTTRIPLRYGSLGCYRKACTLAGGFYPMLVGLGPSGFDRSAPPAPGDYDVTVHAPPGMAVLIGGMRRETAHLDNALHALVRVDGSGHLREREFVHRGVTVTFFHHGGPPPPPLPAPRGGPYLNEDRAALMFETVRDALDLLDELGLAVPAGTRIPLVEMPLRMELALAQAGAVLVSDQLFRIAPLKRFRKFHEFQLVRAIYNFLAEARLGGQERADDLGWSADLSASWLVDLYTVRGYQTKEFARDVLKFASFIPTVDRLLYAPQIQFASAYFNTLDDPDPTRDDLRRFANQRPRGKLLYEKLRDLIGDEQTTEVARAVFLGTPVREAMRRVHGEEPGGWVDAFFAEWLGPYPEVDYRFEVSVPEPAGEGLRYRLRVYKYGKQPPSEPVELRVTEWGGQRHELRWDGQGRDKVFVVETRRPIRLVVLDPRGRLLERVSGAREDLRLNNRRPGKLKFIYNDLGALFNFQTLSLDLSIDFSLSRVYDVLHTTRFALYRNRQAQVGLLASYSRHFGRLITPARPESSLTSSLRVQRLQPSFGLRGAPRVPGTQVVAGVSLASDDRLFVWEPWRATFYGASASYALTVLDDRRVLQQGTVSASFGKIVPIAIGHGVAFELTGAATFGDLVVPSQFLASGAPNFLRGYEPDELLGRMRLFGRAEYRHVFLHDLNFNFLHLIYLRGVAGAVFLEAAALSPCTSYRIGNRDLFGDVGYSLRFLGDWFGVLQTQLTIDVAVPLVRRRRGCVEEEGQPIRDPSTRAPFGFFVYFGPVF
ncbi:MAG TPA: hypothetical protein VH877_09735 [Polyangia bacterium]|nr:hypothetical protein [Polyangia bacterium]